MRRRPFWFLAAILAVLSLLVLGHLTLFDQWKTRHDRQLRRAKIIEEVLRLQRLVVEVETSFRGYLLAGQRAFLEPMQTADARLTSITDRLTILTGQDPGLQAGVEVLRARLKEFIASKSRLTAIADDGQRDQVHLYVRVGDGRALFLTIEKAFQDFEARIDREIPSDDSGPEVWPVRVGWQLLLLDAAGVFACVTITRAFLPTSAKPLHSNL